MIDNLIVALLTLWLLLPSIILVLDFLLSTRINPFLLYLLTTFFGCILIVIVLSFSGQSMSAELDRFDVDGNGFVSEDEMTPEAQRAFDDFARSGGGMESVLACMLTGIWYAIVFAAIWIPVSISRSHQKSNGGERIKRGQE